MRADRDEQAMWKEAAEGWKAQFEQVVERVECQAKRLLAKEEVNTSMRLKIMELESDLLVKNEEIEDLKSKETELVKKHEGVWALGSISDVDSRAQKMKVDNLNAQVEGYRATADEYKKLAAASEHELVMFKGMMVENEKWYNYKAKYDELQARMLPMETRVLETDKELKQFQMQYYLFERNAGIKRTELEKALRSKEAELSAMRVQTDEALVAENERLREVRVRVVAALCVGR